MAVFIKGQEMTINEIKGKCKTKSCSQNAPRTQRDSFIFSQVVATEPINCARELFNYSAFGKKGERKHNRLPGRDGGSGRALTVRNGFKVAMKKIKSRQKHNYYYLFKLANWNESGGLFLPGLGKLPSCVHPVVPLVGDSDFLSNICPANWQEIWKKCQMIRGYG